MLSQVQHDRVVSSPIARLFIGSLLTVIGSLFISSCEREIVTGDTRIATNGYEIRGFVLDRLGNPMPNVEVRVDYDLSLEDTGNPPDVSYTVSAPFEAIQVQIHTLSGVLYRSYPTIAAEPGSFLFTWDKLSASGSRATSGVYFVSYVKGGTQVLRYPVLVQDNTVTVTDSVGRYTVGNEYLPIDFYPVARYSGDGTRFFGNYRVSDQVYLTFQPLGPISSIFRSVRVIRDRVVEFDVRYN